MPELTKEEKIKAEAEAKQRMKESIAKRKEEARLKKEEEERIAAERAAQEAEEKKKQREENKKKREQEIKRAREEKAEAERKAKEEESARIEESKRKRKEQIEKQKEEARIKKEEEERQKKITEEEEKEKIRAKEEQIQKHREAALIESERRREEEEEAKKRTAEEEKERIRAKEEQIQKLRKTARESKLEREKEVKEAKERDLESTLAATNALKGRVFAARQDSRIKKEAEEAALLKAKEEARQEEEEAAKAKAASLRKHKEEIQRQKKVEEERIKKAKAEEEKSLQGSEKAMKEKIKARKQLVAEQEEAKRLEKEALRKQQEDELAEAKEAQRRIIEANKEEAKRRREEEEEAKLAVRKAEATERAKVSAERQAKRKEELRLQKEAKEAEAKAKHDKEVEELKKREEERKEAQKKRREELMQRKAEEEEAERVKREELEAERIKLEEEQKVAMKKHMEEVRAKMEEEVDLEEEEKQKLEAARAREFEEEQIRRKIEMERIIKAEEDRRIIAEEKMKKLGIKSPVNRCGLFTVFGEEPGLEIWVLGDHQISKIAKKKHGLRGLIGESHGSFHVERAYIILHTSFSQGFYHYQLSSWVGKEASDETKSQAAERMSELETGLVMEDLESINLEYQGEESARFRAYFDKEIEYVQSVSLKSTEGPNYLDKSMYHIKGRNMVHCKRVDAIPENLNSGDVFVLEDSFGIYQFNGVKSNKMERGKALDFGVQLRIERNARVRVHIIDEGNPQCEHESNKFWASLRLDRDNNGEFILPEGSSSPSSVGATPTGLALPIIPADESGDDIAFEKAYAASWKMFQVAPLSIPADLMPSEDLEVALTAVEISAKGPSVNQLNDWNVIVLDCDTEIFIWYGNFSSQKARAMARTKAKALRNEPNRDACTIITKVRQQTEKYMFKEKFVGSWGEYADFDFTEEHIRGNVANLVQEDVNIDCMYFPEKYANASEDRALPIPNKDDSVDSSLEIYLVTERDKLELKKEEHGIFFSGNCYVMLYELRFGVDHAGNDKSRHVVYFWQGSHSSRDDRGLSALIAGDVAKRLRFSQVVRVIQNKEPEHFLSHFNSAMVIPLGQRPNGEIDPFHGRRLYHIRGTNDIDVHACETYPDVTALNTNDTFVLIQDKETFIWKGKGANQSEKKSADLIAEKTGGNIYESDEGEESGAFWEILGGKGAYASSRVDESTSICFECTNTIGIFKVYRVEHFSQPDLINKNCVILDGGKKLYVWVGSEANEACVSMTMETAKKYAEYESDEKPKRTDFSIVEEKGGSESLEFQGYFHTWDKKQASESRDKYQDKLDKLRVTKKVSSPLPTRRRKK